MQPHEKLYEKRKRRAFGGSVEGQGTARRLDRAQPKAWGKASGGSIKERFNAAVNDQPARPTINEPNAVNAVHLLKRGGRADPWGDKHEDKAADAAMIKSAIRQHETAEHGGEHRPIKLARGGEARDYDKGWVEGQPAKGGGRLTAHERQRLPKSDFALPGKGAGPKGAGSGSYPIPDASHARNALARVSQHGSPAEKAAVRAKVHAKYPGIGES